MNTPAAAVAAPFPTFNTPARVIPELTWSHTLCDGERVDFAEAEQAIAALNTAGASGFSDWRLPTVEELFAQADRSKFNPAVDPEQFPDTRSGFYWSSTPYAVNPAGYAWGVYFNLGGTSFDDRDYYGFVRAVRSVVPASPGQ